MTTTGAFWKKADEFAKLGKPKIAFGLKSAESEILASIARCTEYADIRLVGPRSIASIRGFELIIDDEPEEKLASLLANDDVDGIVRGTIDDKKTLLAYQRLTREVDRICPALMEVSCGQIGQEGQNERGAIKKQFFICPVSNTDGWTKEARFDEAIQTANFVKEWDIEPHIAVYMAMRHGTEPSGIPAVDQTRSDADWIVDKLTNAGLRAKNAGIDLDIALVDDYNIHVPVNGMVGNQIYRAFLFCGGKGLTATRIGFSRPYEDNSRSDRDFEPHIRWLVGYINKKKHGSAVKPASMTC